MGGVRTVGRLAGRGLGVLSTPFKFVGGAIFKVTKLVSSVKQLIDPKTWAKFLLKKLGKMVLSLIASNTIPAIMITVILVLIVNLMTIMDAISSTYENFVSKTTMGATYAKLLDKERDFAAQVSALTEEKIPDGIGHDIKEWTNYKVHFIGADGKEMQNSLESTGGSVMIGNGNSNGETKWMDRSRNSIFNG